jgi:hypothetical protein
VLVGAALLLGVVRLGASAEQRTVFAPGAAGRAASATPVEATPGEGKKSETAELNARSDWFYKQRAYPGDATPAGARGRAIAQAHAVRAAGPPARPLGAPAAPTAGAGAATAGDVVPAAPTAPLTWTSLGPSPIGARIAGTDYYQGAYPLAGRVTAIATHPTLADTAYIGAADGGVWKTENGGASWTPKFDGQASLSIGAIAIAPSGTVWVGTGEGNESGDAYFGAGLFKSIDGGTSWTNSGTAFDACHVTDIRVDPNDSNRVIVAVHRFGRYVTSCANGLYRTSDGGTTWSLLSVAGIGTYSSGALHEPLSLTVANAVGATTWYAGFWGDGVFKSVNGGDSWTLVKSAAGAGRVSVAAARNDPARVATVMENASTGQVLGIWSSTNGGTDWTPLTVSPSADAAAQSISFCSTQCWYDLTSAVADDGTVYAGGLFVWKQSGTSVTDIGFKANGSGIHSDQHALSFDASGRLWVGSDGGVYRTPDGGVSFSNLNAGLSINQIEPGISGSLAGTFVAGSQDTGTNRYTGSTSWTQIFGGDGGASAVAPGPVAGPSDDTIYVSYTYGTAYKSTNGGLTWTYITSVPKASGDGVQFYAPFAMDPSDSNRLYLGMTRLWRSTDAAATPFVAISPQFGVADPANGITQQTDYWGQITAIGLAPSTTSTIYVGTAGRRIARTTDAGAPTPTWTPVTTGLPTRTVTDIEVKPTDSTVAFASFSSFNAYTPAGHVFLTTTGGSSWTNVSGNLPDSPVNALAIDWSTSPATIYAGTDVGVFWSNDGGTNWANTSANLPTVVIMDLKIDATANRLIVGTHGRGVWSAPLPTVAPAVPTISSFTPSSGGTGSTVTITGTNFTGATAVSVTFAPATTFTVVNSTTITATVPPNIPNPGRWRVTTPAGTAVSTDLFTPTAPIVSSFTPPSGPNNSTVTITGTNFTGTTSVSLYYVNAPFTVVNDTTITAQVPEGVPGPGKWRVNSPNGTGTSPTQFTPTAPIVSGYTPSSGAEASTVTITGLNFTGATQVTLYFLPATFTVVNSTTITAQVPTEVPGPGRWRVTTPAGTGASATQFVPTAPLVSGFTPSTGPSGTTVTISGSNFTGATHVTLFFREATFVVVNPTTITAQVPADVPGPGRWRITTPNGTGASATQFAPTSPAVTGLSATSGPVGSTVTITGINFTGATQVSLYFVNATFTFVNSTTITATVPAGVPGPGRWRVTTPLGVGLGPTVFTVT